MDSRADRIWVVWEHQRRSEELSRRLGCETHVFDYRGLWRYPRCIAATAALLVRRRPHQLFVQNPSMVLAALACIYGLLPGTTVVVDRHTTFGLNREGGLSLRWLVFLAFHHFTLRLADLTIVTNEPLAELVRRAGGTPFVLPDPVPALEPTGGHSLEDRGSSVLVISSFGYDEPVAEVLAAAAALEESDVRIYVTGNVDKAGEDWRDRAPDNVEFTGFVPAADFVDLLFGVDAVMVLTTADHTMLCGCYEAVAAGQPLITSDKLVLRDYFEGAEFVEPTSESIQAGLERVLSNLGRYRNQTIAMRDRMIPEWSARFAALEARLDV